MNALGSALAAAFLAGHALAGAQVLDDAYVLPDKACRASQGPLVWETAGHRCAYGGARPAVADGTQQVHVYAGPAGAEGAGYIMERCIGGRRVVIASWCKRWCAGDVTIAGYRWNGGRRVYEGDIVEARNDRGRRLEITCRNGEWTPAR